MEIPFKAITIKDKEIITSFTFKSDYMNCDFSFTNMCSWRFLYESEYAVVDNFLLIRFWIENKERPVYMCPVGEGFLPRIISLLEEDSLANGYPLLLLGITNPGKKKLEEALPCVFEFTPERDYFDYIYLREDLIKLSGKKYQAKRNHINNFKKNYAYKYMPITPEIIPQCIELEHKWYKANRTEDDAEELSFERRSLTHALIHAEQLGLIGGAICVDGQIVAFSFGAPINHNTFAVHVEKADVNYSGAYNIINQEFAMHIPEQYIYVNREEDLGIPGLRQAKESYNPTILLEKFSASKKASSIISSER